MHVCSINAGEGDDGMDIPTLRLAFSGRSLLQPEMLVYVKAVLVCKKDKADFVLFPPMMDAVRAALVNRSSEVSCTLDPPCRNFNLLRV